MKTNYLLPHNMRIIGWIILIPGLILGMLLLSSDFEYPEFNVTMYSIINNNFPFQSGNNHHFVETNIFNELAILLLTIGGMVVAFSEEKVEDEYIRTLRLESLIWATIINYILLTIASLLLFDFNFLNFMVVNMFTLLFLFIIRFRIKLYNFNRRS